MKNVIVFTDAGYRIGGALLALLARRAHQMGDCNVISVVSSGSKACGRYTNWLVNPDWVEIPVHHIPGSPLTPLPEPTRGSSYQTMDSTEKVQVKEADAVTLFAGSYTQTMYSYLRHYLKWDDELHRKKFELVLTGLDTDGEDLYSGYLIDKSSSWDWLDSKLGCRDIKLGRAFHLKCSEEYRIIGSGPRLTHELIFPNTIDGRENKLLDHLDRVRRRNEKLRAESVDDLRSLYFPEWERSAPHPHTAWAFWKLIYPGDGQDKFWYRVLDAIRWHPHA